MNGSESTCGMDVRKFFDLSTAHMTSKDNILLKEAAKPDYNGASQIYVIDKDQGYIVIPTFGDDPFEARAKMLEEGFSLALVDLCKLAYDNDMTGLWFDSDAAAYKEYPCFDWMEDDRVYYEV
jgi:hypothetical protein